jgi:ribose-phosphate pyrophosphokinase
MKKNLALVATRSSHEYLQKVVYQLRTFPEYNALFEGKNLMVPVTTSIFADGEMEVEIGSSLRGKNVFLFTNSARNENGISVDASKIELYHTIDALNRAQPEKITLFEPYCTASRSDRTTRRNSVGIWVHFKILMSLGVNHIITYQLHSDKSKTVLDPGLCAIDDIPAITLLMKYITDTNIKSLEALESVVQDQWRFCSVDAGGENIARKYASSFGSDLVIAHKQRDYSSINRVDSINILSSSPLSGKKLWIVDDMIDTGGSIFALVKELKKRDVEEVNILAVHPVFSEPAVDRLSSLWEEGLLKRVVVTDTVACPECLKETMPFLEIVSSARLSAEIIWRLQEERSLTPFFEPFDARKYLSSLKLFI